MEEHVGEHEAAPVKSQSWTDGLRRVGVYHEGFVRNIDDVLAKHGVETVTTYGTRRSRKIGIPSSNGKENNPLTVSKLYWRKMEGNTDVSFDDSPFTVDREVVLHCQYGPHYWQKTETAKKQLRLQSTRKIGCCAHIKIRYYTVYRKYQLNNVSSMASRELRDYRERTLKELRCHIASGLAKGEEWCFVSLPSRDAHMHPTGEESGFSQRIHPMIVVKISELVASGITNVHEVLKILRHYVHHTVSVELNIAPSLSNRAFYPMPCDIENHVSKAKKALQLSKLDQENLRLKIEEWRKSSPSSSHYFRPYIKKQDVNDGQSTAMTSSNTEAQPNTSNDDHFASEYTQTLLWIHQEKWQQDLLVKYGNTITLIDATYKTTKYEVPLFFLSVKTNVGYIVVAEFVISSESAEEIGEAISILKEWNPEWNPAFFMSDYSEAEFLAVQQVFPSTISYICDFHREQAWERWTKNHKHGLTSEEGEKVLDLLRDCAHAPIPSQDEKLSVDYYYQCALKRLKKSCVWKDHIKLQEWLNGTWLGIPQKWARAYRQNSYHAAVETNNGIEAQNKVLKHSYLTRNRNINLSQLANILIFEFLPDSYRKYLFQNCKMDSSYRSYSEEVPEYLHGRPPALIKHCLNRLQKAKKKFRAESITACDDIHGKFTIAGESSTHHIDFGITSGQPSCTCGDWAKTHFPCKHFCAIFLYMSNWGWDSLPSSYLGSAYLCADTKAQSSMLGVSVSKDVVSDDVKIVDQVCSGGQIGDQEISVDTADIPDSTVSGNYAYSDEEDQDHHTCVTKGATQEVESDLQKRTYQESRKAQQQIRIHLKQIETLTFNVTDAEKLQVLKSKCHELERLARELTPATEGLVLRPTLKKTLAARRAKLKFLTTKLSTKVSSLDNTKCKRGRRKLDWKFRNRVGFKAAQFRKAHMQGSAASKGTNEQIKHDKQKVVLGKKRKRCGECDNCKREDCGQCKMCKDKPKFGGPNRKKQCCELKKCLQVTLSSNPKQCDPWYRTDYDPQDGPEYRPECDPQDGPEYRPEYDPQDGPEYRPEYDPQDGPEYDPQDRPEYRPEYDPQDGTEYRPEYDPQDGPEYDPQDGPECEPIRDGLNLVLIKQRRKLFLIDSDGNCMFRSLSFLFYGHQTAHSKLRSLLVNFISLNKSCFNPLIFTGSFDDHIAAMKCLGKWGTQVELQAAASIVQVPIYVLTKKSMDSEYHWILYKPYSKTSLRFPDELSLSKNDHDFLFKGTLRHLELCHTNRNHYDCVVTLSDQCSVECPALSGCHQYVGEVL